MRGQRCLCWLFLSVIACHVPEGSASRLPPNHGHVVLGTFIFEELTLGKRGIISLSLYIDLSAHPIQVESACGLLVLAFVHYHDVSLVHACVSIYQYLILFYVGIIPLPFCQSMGISEWFHFLAVIENAAVNIGV